MFQNSRVIIIGSGYSAKEGIDKGLFDKLKDEYTFILNYAYKYICGSIYCFVDAIFYHEQKDNFKYLPLIVGCKAEDLKQYLKDRENLILLPRNNKFCGKDSWVQGFYSPALVGIFSLTLAVACGFKEVYLIGYDFCGTKDPKDGVIKTHWYQDYPGATIHRGVGVNKHGHYRTSTYQSNPKKFFDKYIDLPETKIYNVSTNSRIESFPKLTWEEFFARLDVKSETADHQKLREFIISQKRPG